MLDEMKLLKDLEYTRAWCSKQEKEAAHYISSVLDKLKVSNSLETFKLNDAKCVEVSLEVIEPYKKKYRCKFFKMAGNAKNLVKDLVYISDRKQPEFYDVKDKIVLMQGRISYWTYKKLFESGCAGLILGDGIFNGNNYDIDTRELREPLQKIGKLPIVQCHIKDLFDMVYKGATKVKITTIQKYIVGTSQNVVAKIPGEDKRNIIFTAHYDSTALSKGSWDNASGSVCLLKLAEYFKENKPKHSLIFVWCGSEERGLQGSKAYVKKHVKQLDKIELCINVDMIGAAIGRFLSCVSANKKAVNYVKNICLKYKKPCYTYQGVYSSDSTPFADNGVPAISFSQDNPKVLFHCRYDDMKIMSKKTMKDDIDFILKFSLLVDEAKKMPIKREIPKMVKDRLDVYLLRKKGK